MARFNKAKQRHRRHTRVRKRVAGTAECPRLSVYRSLRHMYAQIIDDSAGRVLAAASTQTPDVHTANPYGGNVDAAKAVGTAIADRAKAAGVERVVFDRGGFQFHGRLRALAEAAREAGLKF